MEDETRRRLQPVSCTTTTVSHPSPDLRAARFVSACLPQRCISETLRLESRYTMTASVLPMASIGKYYRVTRKLLLFPAPDISCPVSWTVSITWYSLFSVPRDEIQEEDSRCTLEREDDMIKPSPYLMSLSRALPSQIHKPQSSIFNP